MATFYVKNGGNDGLDGLSDGNAWATLAKVNSTVLVADDIVSLKRDSLWRESLSIAEAGSSGHPITFTDYGTGELPAICGADLLTGWAAHPTIPDVWVATWTDEPKFVLFDGEVGTEQGSAGACSAEGDWYWTGTELCVFATSDPDILYTDPGIEVPMRDSGVSAGWTAGRDYNTFENIRVYGTNEGPGFFSSRCAGWVLNGVTIEKVGRTGYQARAAVNHTLTGCTITGIRELNPGWRGVYFYYESDTYPGSGNTVTGCDITQWGGYGIQFIGSDSDHRTTGNECTYNDLSHNGTGCYLSYCDESEVAYNTCDDNVQGGDPLVEQYGIAIQTGSNNEVHHNIVRDGYQGMEIWAYDGTAPWPDSGPSDGNKVHHNQFSGHSKYGFQIYEGCCDNTEVYTNLIFDNGDAGIHISEAQGTGTDNYIYNNTLVGNNINNAGYADIYFGTANAGWTLENNILYNTNRICFRSGNQATSATHGYNCYWRTDSGNVVDNHGTTYTAATIAGFEATGVGADPLFCDVGSRLLWLQAGSPCINAGDDAVLGTGYSDYTGTAPVGIIDIGAYEYGAGESGSASGCDFFGYFGENSDGAGSQQRDANYIKACRFQNTVGSGLLTEIGINLVSGITGHIRLGIYEDEGDPGLPGSALLLDAGELTNPGAGWNTIDGLSLPVTAGEYYWLSWNCDTNTTVYHIVEEFFYYAQAYGALPSSVPWHPAQHQYYKTCMRAGVCVLGAESGSASASGSESGSASASASAGPDLGQWIDLTCEPGGMSGGATESAADDADYLAPVQELIYRFEVYDPGGTVTLPWADSGSAECVDSGCHGYLKSVSLHLGGAGIETQPMAGTWQVEIFNDNGIFHPYHPASPAAGLFQIGREVRISVGAVYDGVPHYHQRMIGFMDAPRFDHGSRTVTLSGMDYTKVLADTVLRDVNTIVDAAESAGDYDEIQGPTHWGGHVAMDSIAGPAGSGGELYAEGDAMEIGGGEANNVANWPMVTPTGSFAVGPGPGPASSFYGRFTRELTGPDQEYCHNSNVAAVTAGNQYVVEFKARADTDDSGYGYVMIYQTASGIPVFLDQVQITEPAWDTYRITVPISATGALQMRFGCAGKYITPGDTFDIDDVSIKLASGETYMNYSLPDVCNGPYFVTVDGDAIWEEAGQTLEGAEGGWHYIVAPARLLCFSEALAKNFPAGSDNIDVYFYTTQTLEHIVADLMVVSGLYGSRAEALGDMDYTATGVTIERVWFEPGTTALKAIAKICERVDYRFWFDPYGKPHFHPAPEDGGASADFALTLPGHLRALADFQDIGVVRNRIAIEGAEQEPFSMREDKESLRFKAEASDATSIGAHLEKTYQITNHLFQDQASVDAMCAALLADFKDPKWYAELEVFALPAPLELGQTVSWVGELEAERYGYLARGIIRDVALNDQTAQYKCEVIETTGMSGKIGLAGWSYRKPITISGTYVDSNLTDFPLCVEINADTDIGGACRADGHDIRFTADDGLTELDYERESFDVSSGNEATGVFWVRVPLISTDGAEIFIYYGNATATDGENATGVWDDDFAAVYHMDDATTSTILDSTANDNDGTKKGANEPVEATGKIGQGQDFDNTDDYIANPIPQPTAPITLELWLKRDANPGEVEYLTWLWGNGAIIGIATNNALHFWDGGAYRTINDAVLADGEWHHLVRIDNGSGSTLEHYLDGEEVDSRASAIAYATAPQYFGADWNHTSGFFGGSMDEVRFSTVARSAAWIKFEYRNMNEADNCLTFGAEE